MLHTSETKLDTNAVPHNDYQKQPNSESDQQRGQHVFLLNLIFLYRKQCL